ncbi:MAG: hypothetical protein Q9227_001241 [Pyrenula ochraceoflavens]
MGNHSDFPIIDISRISDPAQQISIAKAITSASAQWGFLLLKGHPIPAKDINEVMLMGTEFFALTEDQKAPWPVNGKYIGYSAALSDRHKDDKMSMWFGGVPGDLKQDSEALPPYWRERAAKVEKFKHTCYELVIQLLQCFAIALDLSDRNFFAKAHPENAGNGNSLRMLMYPARTEPSKGTRMSPHTDSDSVTLLFQDSAGLEVESPTGEWVKAPCIDSHILVNLGDSLCFWSGGQLKATKHRVTFEGVPHDRARQTMAYFGRAAPDTVLEPIGDRANIGRYNTNGIDVYPGITVGEYGRLIMEQIYGTTLHKVERQA